MTKHIRIALVALSIMLLLLLASCAPPAPACPPHDDADGDLVCDKCGEELTIRSDDAPEVVLSRLEVYHSTTEPLKDFYAAKGNLELVDGVGTVEETAARTFRALGVD